MTTIYSITYKTKRGGSGVLTSLDLETVKKKAISCFKQKLNATIYRNGENIGKVYQDSSCRTGWNWYMKVFTIK